MSLSADQKKFLELLAKNVKRLRNARGYTQQKLAELAELDTRTVQKIEAGELNLLITTIDRLRRALKSGWDELLP